MVAATLVHASGSALQLVVVPRRGRAVGGGRAVCGAAKPPPAAIHPGRAVRGAANPTLSGPYSRGAPPARFVACHRARATEAGPCVEPPERGAITKVQRGADQFLAPLFFPSCPVHVQAHRFTSHRTNVAESRHGLRLVFHCFYSQHSGSAFNVNCRHGTGISTALEGVVQLMVPTIKVRISRFGVFTLP